tara:strand:+ start:3084 stop:3197 length:114 start_codon:yes stop_codon:yes gene_type:complete
MLARIIMSEKIEKTKNIEKEDFKLLSFSVLTSNFIIP